MSVSADQFRALLRRHAAAVVVVTAGGERPHGFTATSFVSVSLAPPLVLFCINRRSSVRARMGATDYVGINVLRHDQESAARLFARPGIDRFGAAAMAGLDWSVGPRGVPVLDGAAATLVVRVRKLVRGGDHVITVAEVVDGSYDEETTGDPLLYHMGAYARLAPSGMLIR